MTDFLRRLRPFAVWIAFLATWEICGRLADVSKLVPPPSAVLMAGLDMLRTGELVRDAVATLRRVALGYTAGAIAAIVTGIAIGRVPWIRDTFASLLHSFRSVPVVALVPVAITWFGLGESSKLFLVVWGVFFPVWISAVVGATSIEPQLIWAARSLGASRFTILFRIVLPGSLGAILGGLRAGISIGFICVVAAEMAGAQYGLGYAVSVFHGAFQTDRMFAALACLAALGAAADWLFVRFIKWWAPWYVGFRSADRH